MAITVTASTAHSKKDPIPSGDAVPFIINAYSADLSGCEELKAAPSAGQIALSKLSVICAVKDITVTIGAGETGGAVTTVIWGPLPFIVEETAAGYLMGKQYTWSFDRMLYLPATTSLTVDASGAGAVLVMAEGMVVA
jgi:hypothetical protein